MPVSRCPIGTGTAIAISKYGYPLVYWQDSELPRQVYESGLLLGGVYILLRVVLAVQLTAKAVRLQLQKNSVAYFFIPSVVFLLVFGQWGNSTILGFTTLSLGILVKLFSPDE